MPKENPASDDSVTPRLLREAEGYMELGMLDDAWECLGKISPEKRDSPPVLALRALLNHHAQSWAELTQVAAQLVELLPDQAQWWLEWAYATRRSHSLQAAQEILLRALERHPNEPLIHFNLACYACQLGDLPAARRLLAQAFRLDKSLRSLASSDPDLQPLWAELPPV